MYGEVTTIDTNNYAVMAKAMGMAGDDSASDNKPKSLPRFRIITLLLWVLKRLMVKKLQ